MSELKEVFLMELPNTQSEEALKLWKSEIMRFKKFHRFRPGAVFISDHNTAVFFDGTDHFFRTPAFSACLTYNLESRAVRRFVTEEKKLPYIVVETDYSAQDTGQLCPLHILFLSVLQ
mgnify:CR=1 FL=1